ncbi:MAG: DUF4404 family protein [Pirellulaceae bacterium]|jgi:predicted component of type VI protein secretion system|nr:DUF4404 family protein [Pirellulaceae bacterium]MDP7019946.1 DUF4404 family protein [Pirellulaceae bacterium]
MEKKQLLDTLGALHEELSQTERVDQSTEDLLKTVTDDIQRLLDQSAEDGDSGTIAGRLQELLLKFEDAHPRLAALVEQVTEGLANLGI